MLTVLATYSTVGIDLMNQMLSYSSLTQYFIILCGKWSHNGKSNEIEP